jgi:diacylglycerol O-acyltransferase / wax synthase
MTTERLSSLDASFLYLETPSRHMHVAGVSVLAPRADGPLTFEHVERVVAARIHLAPRLRQRVVTVPFRLDRPLWVDDEHFDLDFHVRRAAIPAPGGRFQLERAVGRVLSRPLDRSKPLWELYVYEGLEDGHTAVLMKIHHALADGISGMLVASALFDLTEDAEVGDPPAWAPDPEPTEADLLRGAMADVVSHPLEALVRIAQAPRRSLEVVGASLESLRAIVGMGAAPTGPFDAIVGPNRRFATCEVPFERLRRAKQALGGTVNDVVLAAVAGGLHDLLESRGEPTRGRSLRVMVPVSVRARGQAGDVGNRVAPAFIDLPVGRMTPATRVRRIRRTTAELKASAMAVGADSIIALGAYAPPALHATAARLVSRGHWFNLVVSNIPAPQVPLFLAGARLLASYPAMPLGEDSGLSIACTSLGGTMSFGLTADWDAVPDVGLLAAGIDRALGSIGD